MNKKSLRSSGLPVLGLLVGFILLSGCSPVGLVFGAGAATGIAAYEERDMAVIAKDLEMSALLRARLFDKDPELAAKIGIEVYEGRILLTGVLDTESQRGVALAQAWKTGGVKDVYNEILLGSDGGVLNFIYDSLITTELKSKITLDEKILAINYVIVTVNGTIYLLGIAQDRKELDRVMAYARNLDYVRRIVDHVLIKGAS